MIQLLITIVVFLVVGGLLYYLITLLPLPSPFPQVIQVAIILILILVILGALFGGVPVPAFHLR